MKTLKAYKYRLYPTKKQQEQLQWTLDRARELYNAALQERRDAYEIRVKRHPNYYDEATRKRITQEHALTYTQQATQLAEIKEIRPEYHDIHSQVLQDVLRRVEKAYKAFFRRIKEGKTPGYPRFQGYGRYESFTFPQSGFSLTEDNRVCLSKIGTIKVKFPTGKKARPPVGEMKTCTIKREAQYWYVIFTCKVEQAIVYHWSDEAVGRYLPNGASAKAGLNTSILDAGWGQFQQVCVSKAACAGSRVLFVSPKYTSQMCSGCGAIQAKELKERWHPCP